MTNHPIPTEFYSGHRLIDVTTAFVVGDDKFRCEATSYGSNGFTESRTTHRDADGNWAIGRDTDIGAAALHSLILP